jgi:succinate-semialdehyde dehydrogenase/glutarate-semialdehyde dehydrogenase
MRIKDPSLLRTQAYIGGRWIAAESGAETPVCNPASAQRIGTVPDLRGAEVRSAVEAAHEAFPAWAARCAHERSRILRRWHVLMIEHQEDLATLMTAEQGKPLTEARAEVRYAAAFIEWFAEEAKRVYGEIIPGHQADKRLMVLRQPVGVAAAITPWNFPSAMITRKAAPALAAGCTFVVKPASQTPYSALALAVLAERAGIPPGVFNVITSSHSREVGLELTTHPRVRKVSFTGSTAVGKQLMAQSASTLKKLSLELGGNAPFIVFEDADLDAAVAGAMASKYRNTGQTCVCTNRVLVHSRVHEEFSQKLATAVSGLRVGDGLAGATDQGPLIDEPAVLKVEELLADAIAKGARVVCGGRRHALGGTFFEPTVLADATPAMLLSREEMFGPVAPLFRFETEAQAIRMANDTEYGLAAYVYTRDLSRAWRVSEALECGMVGLNTGLISSEVVPFGGVKESGFGREGSRYGILEYTELKCVCVGL